MKTKTWKKMLSSALYALLAVVVCTMASCSDDNEQPFGPKGDPFDPSKPVTVTKFTPESGGAGQQLVIYGTNFGNDTSLVSVTIGGQPAKVVSVAGTSLYCLVPKKAGTGEIEVTLRQHSTEKTGVCEKAFNYLPSKVVGTLCGYRNENDDQGWHDGPFSTVTGFAMDGWMKFDPHPDYNHRLYVVYDGGDIKMLDMEKQEVTTPITRSLFGNKRLRTIDFTNDYKHMLVAVDFDGNGERSASVYVLDRNEETGLFENPQEICAYKQCNGASIHPVNGELYFNSYQRGQVFRMELDDYFLSAGSGQSWITYSCYEELFTIQDTSWEFQIDIHPSGNYAYIVVINQHYILRTDYNWAEKRFAPPYVVVGESRSAGWVDGVGTTARLNRPYQGIFVKNPDYVAEGRDDVYDFYIADCNNHCLRKLTPEGILSTYAGRGSTSLNAEVWGMVEGDLRDEARFRDPTGLAYDEVNQVLYINDRDNRRIRKISYEE